MNMKRVNAVTFLMLAFVCVLSLVGCSDDDFMKKAPDGKENPDTPTSKTEVTATCALPSSLKEAQLSNLTVTIVDISTEETQTLTPTLEEKSFKFRVIDGLYRINLEAEVTYEVEGKALKGKIRGEITSLKVLHNGNKSITIEAQLFDVNQGFVFAEIFFAGTKTPEGKSYYADKYFRIYNNSNAPLDAQGLAIAESAFMSVTQRDYTPDIKTEAMAVGTLYMIPRGKEVMVQPGESLLICDVAKDHREANTNSFNESDADFEWFDETSSNMDIDTEVPNLVKIYSYSKTIWTLHNRGFKSYALVKVPDAITPEKYLQDYTYDYHYDMIIKGQTYPMDRTCYKVPNEWVVDAVNLSVEAKYEWNPISAVLDKGWTYCGTIDKDPTRFGRSVRRKVLSGKFLQDTNDSSVDFLPEQVADPHFNFYE